MRKSLKSLREAKVWFINFTKRSFLSALKQNHYTISSPKDKGRHVTPYCETCTRVDSFRQILIKSWTSLALACGVLSPRQQTFLSKISPAKVLAGADEGTNMFKNHTASSEQIEDAVIEMAVLDRTGDQFFNEILKLRGSYELSFTLQGSCSTLERHSWTPFLLSRTCI